MAQEFNQFSTMDRVVDEKGHFTRPWSGDMDTFYQTLIGYLTPYGMLLPPLTTAQRDSIQSPQNGQMIYNTTLGSAQYFKAGVWTSF